MKNTNHHISPILVIGGNGKTGSRLAYRLQSSGHPVIRASRSGERRFDWNDRDSWLEALAGVRAVYITFHPDLTFPGAAETAGDFAELAVSQGVERLVLLSGRGEEGAQRAERLVQSAGAKWTIVRCAFFNQNFSETFGEAVTNGIIPMPAGDTAEPFVDAADIAEVASVALTEDGHHGEIYELTGPRLLTFSQVAEELSEEIGREIRYVPVSKEEFAAGLTQTGYTTEVAQGIADLAADVLDGRNASLSDGVQRALGRPPRDFRDYARETAATGIWNLTEVAA